MKILDFITLMDLNSKTEAERAKLLCFYHSKETAEAKFNMVDISTLMVQCGYCAHNTSRLKEKLTKGKVKAMLISKGSTIVLEFIPAVLQGLEKEIGKAWQDTETIISNSELIEEAKFCGRKPFIDRLIKQINFTYGNNCYDACAEKPYFVQVSAFVVMNTRTNLFSIGLEFSGSIEKRFLLL